MTARNEQDRREDAVGERVREFYETHPYPPAVEELGRYRERWNDPLRRRADFHLFWPGQHYRDAFTILIAGCGTSQAAKHALRWPEARVTAIDFSANSIQHTEKLKEKYSLSNLKVRQLGVESVGELGQNFDQIVCTGVLHHLPDPDAGLRALREALKSDGAMHLMLYAPYGRAGIYMLQEYCRRLGVRPTPEEIRELAASLNALPRNHPLVQLREAADFQTEAALADALLHPQDRAYSVPQLFSLLVNCGLRFGRWLRQAPYLPQCGVIAGVPHAARIAQLPAAEQYAAIELLRGTMVRHSVIAYRDDYPMASASIGFDDDAWLQYIPLRLPETRVIEERLPPGAAAVLINSAHTYTDIYLPIDADEKQLFHAIDGKRTTAQLVAASKSARWSGDKSAARQFFERLWHYDQVVFDTPAAGQRPSAANVLRSSDDIVY